MIVSIAFTLPCPSADKFFKFPMKGVYFLPLHFGFGHIICMDERNVISSGTVPVPNLSLKKHLCLCLPSHTSRDTSIVIMRRI